MNKNLSKHDRIAAVIACQKVEEFKGRHAYLHGLGMGKEEYGVFWLRSDNTTWGHTFGRMIGFKELVTHHFEEPPRLGFGFGPSYPMPMGEPMHAEDEDSDLEPEGGPTGRLRPKKPDGSRPITPQEMYGDSLYGHDSHTTFASNAHILGSPVIEVADDGKSARAFYLTPGNMYGVNGHHGGRCGMWLWERYGSDFVYRDGRWWWFHEQVCPDFCGDMDDENWAQDRFRKYLNQTLEIGRCSTAADISDARAAHNDISIIQTVQDTVPAPEPYEKLDDEHTYSVGYNDFSGPLYPSCGGYGDYLY